MPRPIIKTDSNNRESSSIFSISNQPHLNQSNNNMTKSQLDTLLRKKRSKEYIEAIKALDTGGNIHNSQATKKIIDAIKREFPEVFIEPIMLGFVAECMLGAPYEVHTLDITGGIIEHYKKGFILPDGLEKARSIARSGNYAFIEVYVDCCRAVSSDGQVSVIR